MKTHKWKNVIRPITNANDENSLENNIASRFRLSYKPQSGFFFQLKNVYKSCESIN